MKSYTAEDILSLPFDHFTFVDLRTEEEYQLATIPGAIWIPFEQIGQKLEQIPNSRMVCVFCAVGDISVTAAELLCDFGYDAVNLEGGFSAYQNARNQKLVYLDYAANTPTDPLVLECYQNAVQMYSGNPNSAHFFGRTAKQAITEATRKIAAMLEIHPDEIIYTSGASESNNTAIQGFAYSKRRQGKHIISTCLEHSSVSGTLTFLQEQGYEIDLVSIQEDGTVDLEELKQLLREDTILVTICAVDSELGVIQPIEKIAEILKEYPNCAFHVDATQAIGKIPFFFQFADTISFAPHKFYGLGSCGVLYKKSGVVLEPLIHGGASTTLYRSGTPDPAMILSAEKAIELAVQQYTNRYQQVKKWNDQIRTALLSYPLVRINSPKNASPYILNISVKGIKARLFQQILDWRGIAISTKSACSVPNTPSRAVYAITHDRKNALCSWRISLSHFTTQADIEYFLNTFDECYQEYKKSEK